MDQVRLFASLVIVKDGKFLTNYHTHKDFRPWRFAGGKVEQGETPLEAAARECREELGVGASYLGLIYVTEPYETVSGVWQGFFFETLLKGEPRIAEPDKVTEQRYMTLAELKELNPFPEYRVACAYLRGKQGVDG